MSWTDEKVELLRQLWLDGRSASQISTALGQGLTRNAVIGKVHRLGLAGRTKSSSSTSPGSAGAPRSSSPRRAAARSATGSEAVISDGGGASGGAVSSGRVVHGNTVMAVLEETAVAAQPLCAKEVVVVPMSLRVSIVELKESMCRWPLGDPTSTEFRYCGSPAPGSGPYCTHHGKLAYQPVQDRRRERDRRILIAH